MDGDLRNMAMSFRVTELQTLLGYFGKNKSGRKNELQARALELVKHKNGPIASKIKELYRVMQQSMAQCTVVGVPTPIQGTFNANSTTVSSISQARLFNGSSGYSGSAEKVLQGINPFNTYSGSQKSQPVVTMPICPDVKMKRLPFYDIVSELIKPTSLMPQGRGQNQEASYTFCLTPTQAADIASSKEFVAINFGEQKLQFTIQVQLRFCALDTSSDQDDQFPPNIVVKVNGKMVPLPSPIPSNRPGVEPKRPSRPLNVTNYVRLSPTMQNTVNVMWGTDNSRGFAMSLYLVKKLTASDLLSRLKQKGVRPADYSRGMIKELTAKDDGDCMIAMTSLKVTIACPLGRCKMTLPARATTCKHLQCFDASLFLQMNERKPTWVCPVCDKATLFDDLCIDGYFQDVISKMPSGCLDVELLPDASWKPLDTKPIKKEREECSPPTKKMKSDSDKFNETICLEDDILLDEDCVKITKMEIIPSSSIESSQTSDFNSGTKKADQAEELIDLTLDSSDDDEPDIPLQRPKRKTTATVKYVEDDSSSSSSSATTDGSAHTCPASPVQPMSPACITLDSRSPTPEARVTNTNGKEGNSSSTATASASNSSVSTGIAAFSSVSNQRACDIASSTAPVIRSESQPPAVSMSSFDYGSSLGQTSGYSTRSGSSQPISSNNVYSSSSAANYMPFDSNIWGPNDQGTYPNPQYPPDYGSSQLDFSALEFYNQYEGLRGGHSAFGRWP